MGHRACAVAVLVAAVISSTVIAAPEPNELRPAAIESARHSIERLNAKARHGELTQGQLRAARKVVEARLASKLASLPSELRPGEFERIEAAQSRLNQQLMRSMEWEAFGPHDRPEWGWYPSRQSDCDEGVITLS